MEKFLCVVCYETSVTNDQKEKYEFVSAYTDAAAYKFTLFASLVIHYWALLSWGFLEKGGEFDVLINVANATWNQNCSFSFQLFLKCSNVRSVFQGYKIYSAKIFKYRRWFEQWIIKFLVFRSLPSNLKFLENWI